MVHLQALCSHLFMNADGAQRYSIMGCAFLHGFLLYLKQSAYFCSSRLRRTFKKLMASFWAINTKASCNQVHVFLNYFLNEVWPKGCLCKQACLLLQQISYANFSLHGKMGFFSAWNRWNWTNINRERRLLHIVYRGDGLFPSNIWHRWLVLLMFKNWVHTIALASVIETFSNFPNTTFPLLI